MKQRPTSITVVAWILIVIAAINLVTSAVSLNNPMVQELMAKNPIPIPVQYVMLFLGLAVMLASGIGMLNGHNWARLLYVIWSAIGFVVALATSPMKAMLIPGVLSLLVFVFFLFRPAANHYFATDTPPDGQSI